MSQPAMQVLVLIDGLHTKELFTGLSRLIALENANLLLVYVRGPGPRAGLELLRHRPGRRPPPPHREREMTEAEVAGGAEALAEAEALAGSLGATVETTQVGGEPGRAVCKLAAERGVELVVVRAGGRDRPPIGPGSLGPTARFITDHSPSPVLLIRNVNH